MRRDALADMMNDFIAVAAFAAIALLVAFGLIAFVPIPQDFAALASILSSSLRHQNTRPHTYAHPK